MDPRHLQVKGRGTFLVSLPIVWAKRNNLKRGSFIAVTERNDRCIVIDPKYSKEKKLSSIIISLSTLFERKIIGKYLLGYDFISVNSKEHRNTVDRERIKKIVSYLMGLEIVEENSHNIVLQCLLEPVAFPPSQILRREYIIRAGINKDAISSFIVREYNLTSNIIERDSEVNRLYFLLVRLHQTIIQTPKLSESMTIPLITCLDYRLVASLVEALGDHATKILKTVKDVSNYKLPSDVYYILLNVSELICNIHKNAINTFFSNAIKLAEDVDNKHVITYELLHDLAEISARQDTKYLLLISGVASSLKKICDCRKDIGDLVIAQ